MRETLSKVSDAFVRLLWGFAVLVEISILVVICSAPIVTLFAAVTAAYRTISDVMIDEKGQVFGCFFRSFIGQMKTHLLIGVMVALILTITTAGVILTRYYQVQAPVFVKALAQIQFTLVYVFSIWVSIVSAQCDYGMKETFIHAFYYMVRFLAISVFTVIGGMIVLFVGIVDLPTIMVLPGAYLWIIVMMTERTPICRERKKDRSGEMDNEQRDP